MSNIVVGTQSAIEQPQSYGYVPGKGFHRKRRWKVTNPNDIPVLLSPFENAGYPYEVSPERDGAFSIVEVTIESPTVDESGQISTEPLAEIWERDANSNNKAIFQSDKSAVVAVTNTRREVIKRAVEAKTADPSFDATETTLYNLLLNDVESIQQFTPVVRRTRITASSYTVKASDTNMGKILTTAQMTSLEGCPDTVLFALPETPDGTSRPVAVRVGWLKKPARVQQQGDGKWQIVQEYDWDNWAALLYDAAS